MSHLHDTKTKHLMGDFSSKNTKSMTFGSKYHPKCSFEPNLFTLFLKLKSVTHNFQMSHLYDTKTKQLMGDFSS